MNETKIIDARNSFCPGPLMELIRVMKQASVGEVLELLSTDDGTANDVPEWVAKVGHEFISSQKTDGVWHVIVRKSK